MDHHRLDPYRLVFICLLSSTNRYHLGVFEESSAPLSIDGLTLVDLRLYNCVTMDSDGNATEEDAVRASWKMYHQSDETLMFAFEVIKLDGEPHNNWRLLTGYMGAADEPRDLPNSPMEQYLRWKNSVLPR
jgi:hypothetical protein